MGKTVAEKVFSAHSGTDAYAGDFVEAEVDYVMANDITGAPAIEAFNQLGMEPIREKIVLIPDHFVPAKDIASAIQARKLRDFVWKYGIENYFEVGRGGVCHQVMMEQGFAAPGRLIAGADSHTCTYGALGAISVGIGSTEAGVIFATGRMWFRVPQSMRFQVDGEPDPYVEGKDIILRVISEIGVEGARYRSMEFYGSTISLLDVAERMTIANMTTEAGAKCAYVHVDKKTHEYLRGRVRGTYREVSADSDAEYVSDIHIDATELEPQVALPGSPDNVRPVSEVDDHIDQAYIGSCTNGRLEDIRKAAEILRAGRFTLRLGSSWCHRARGSMRTP